MQMEGSVACAGNDWEKAEGGAEERRWVHICRSLQQDGDLLLFLTGRVSSPASCFERPPVPALFMPSQLARPALVLPFPTPPPPNAPPWALHFSGGDSLRSLSSPKGFPSASDYLWLQLGRCQPSGPRWRLRSLSPLQTALREGWRGGGEENREGSHLADAAVRSQETQVGAKGTHEAVTPHLGSALFLERYDGPGEVIFHCLYKADLLCLAPNVKQQIVISPMNSATAENRWVPGAAFHSGTPRSLRSG